MRIVWSTLVLAVLSGPMMLEAQDPFGSFSTTNEMGGTVTLTLVRETGGQVSGSLSSADVVYAASAVYEDGTVMGTLMSPMGGVYFSAEMDGDRLVLTLFEPYANNQPNYETGTTLVLDRVGGAEPGGAAAPPPDPSVVTPQRGAPAAPQTGSGAPPDVATGLRIAFGLPRIVAANLYLSRSIVVEGVYQATALSGGAMMGRIVSTGTLTQGYGGAFQYSPQPADRLVVHYAGQVHEFVIQEAQGNSQAMNSDAWLSAPHQLRYRHRMGDQAEAAIFVRFDGSAFESSVQGWTTQWSARYDMNLQATGRGAGVRDYGGQDVQTTYDLTGTITGNGVELTVNERHTSSLVAATSLRLLPSQRGSASQSTSTLNNTLNMRGVRFQLQNVQVQTGTRVRRGEGTAGMTGLSGTVLRDGQPFGQFVMESGRAFLNTGDGVIAMGGAPGGSDR